MFSISSKLRAFLCLASAVIGSLIGDVLFGALHKPQAVVIFSYPTKLGDPLALSLPVGAQYTADRLRTPAFAHELELFLQGNPIAVGIEDARFGGKGGVSSRISSDKGTLEVTVRSSKIGDAIFLANAISEVVIKRDTEVLSVHKLRLENELATMSILLQRADEVNKSLSDKLKSIDLGEVISQTPGTIFKEFNESTFSIFSLQSKLVGLRDRLTVLSAMLPFVLYIGESRHFFDTRVRWTLVGGVSGAAFALFLMLFGLRRQAPTNSCQS